MCEAESDLRILQALNYHTWQFTSLTGKLKHLLHTSLAPVGEFLMFFAAVRGFYQYFTMIALDAKDRNVMQRFPLPAAKSKTVFFFNIIVNS